MRYKNLFYPETKFGGFTDIDGTMAFYNRVNSLIEKSSVLLDVGCGRGAYGEDPVPYRRQTRIMKGKAKKTIGIDVFESARDNPFLDEFRLISGDRWPVNDNEADLIICDNVLEHIKSPESFFTEAIRVLKDGGHLCIRTPNRWSYIGIIASLIPNRFHAQITARAQDSRKEADVFPTYYRCNSLRVLRRMLKKGGFDSVVYGYEAEPSYLSFSAVAYFFGVVHQKLAPLALKPSIFAFGKISKP